MPDLFSPDIMNKVIVAVVSAVTPLTIGAVYKLMKLITDHAELKGKTEALSVLVAALAETKGNHDTRIALVERAVTLMESISPVIRDLANVSSRLEALQEQTNRRLEMLENRSNH